MLLRLLSLAIVVPPTIVSIIARTVALYLLHVKYLLAVLLVARLYDPLAPVVLALPKPSSILNNRRNTVLKAIGQWHLIKHFLDILNVLAQVAGLHQLAIGSGPLESTLVDRRVPVLVDDRDVGEERGVLLHGVLDAAGWLTLATESTGEA